MATLAVADQRYEAMFLWLGLAFVIDGIDGPLARYVDIKRRLPRFSGERLDLVIDYLTYVFVPVLAVLNAGLLPSALALPIGAGMLLSSLYHFSDTASKAEDNSFIGFPAIWNIVAFYLFVFQPAAWIAALACVVCIGLTFVPVKWVHPMRVVSRRSITLAMLAFWLIAAAAAVAAGFGSVPLWCKVVLLAVAAYALSLPFLADAKAPRAP
ncbi:MAG: phosphatidylcholine synthase [Hyphomicrobiaceae bacterium]|nr:phosphatidylcholine synthase [Hyphomicrobiaceae bacterium]